ncbi:MAG: InlB B-repeat-containing protein [Treponema sp.]|nr:InlB B-repeat-containing protein [Treponema sp.]
MKKALRFSAFLLALALIFTACPGTPAEYEVTFEMQNKANDSTEIVEEGKTVAEPTPPVNEDYDFLGWHTHTNFTNNNKYNFSTPVTGDLTLYANWKVKDSVEQKVTVQFDTAAGSTVSTQIIKFGDQIGRPVDPTKQDFIFKAWYTSTNFEDEDLFDFDTPIGANMTLFAFWDTEMLLYNGFNWMIIDDSKETDTGEPGGTPIGNSTIYFVEEADIDGMKVFSVAGEIDNGFQYGFALLSAQATDAILEDLRRARKITFWIQGDGKGVDVKLPQEDIKGPMEGGTGDSAFYFKRINATATPTQHTLTIPETGTRGTGSDFAQPTDWGVKKDYDQTTLEQINFQTTLNGQKGTFAFKVWGFELLFE